MNRYRVAIAFEFLRNRRKTAPESSAPPEGRRSSLFAWQRAAVTFALLFVIPFAYLAGAPAQAVVSVKVTNPHGKPVDDAAVILDFLGSHQIEKLGKRKPIHWEVHTDQEGRAHFPPIPQGMIRLQVVAKNYQTTGNKYEVDSNEKNFEIQLNPPQQQYSAHPPLKPADPPSQ